MRAVLCLFVATFSFCILAEGLPSPKPGEAHKPLAMQAGTWDCTVKMFFQGPDGAPSESTGVEENKLLCGGLFLQTKFTCKMADRDFEGHGLLGYDTKSKKYTGTWADNFTPGPTPMEGEYDEKAKTFTVNSTVTDEGGNQIKQKQVTTWPDDSTRKFELFWVVAENGVSRDVKIMELVAKKRK